jgi:hypothetical protein
VRNEELQDLYSWPNTIGVTKSRGMRLALHVARMGERLKLRTGFSVGKTEERDNLKYLFIDRSVILKSVFNKLDRAWTALIWFKI